MAAEKLKLSPEKRQDPPMTRGRGISVIVLTALGTILGGYAGYKANIGVNPETSHVAKTIINYTQAEIGAIFGATIGALSGAPRRRNK